jgi:3-oxoadipate enol-lactonase
MRLAHVQAAGLGMRCAVDDGAAGAPWLLLIHCLGGSLELWSAQAPLASSLRLLAYDLRGQGESVAHETEYSIADLADDAVHLLDALSIDSASIVGLSMGGLVAQAVAAHFPERVERLVLAHSTAFFPSAAAASLRERAKRAERGELAAIAGEAMQRTLTDGFRERNPAEVARLQGIFGRTSPNAFAMACRAMANFDGRAALAEIRAPALVIGGDSDPISPPDLARSLAGGIAGSRLVFLPAVHLSNIERPADFNQIVMDFVLRGTTP